LGRNKEAAAIFRKVLSIEPNSARAHVNLGIALADGFDLQAALDQFSQAVHLSPQSPEALYNKSRVLYDMGQYAEARQAAEKAYHLSSNSPSVLLLLALIERQSLQYSKSADYLLKLVSVDPNNSVAQYMLGQDLLKSGNVAEGIRHWKIAVKANPDNSEALYNLARTLRKMGDPQGKAYLERFKRIQKTRQLSDRVQTLNNFALQAANAHDWPLAFAQLKDALRTCGSCRQLPILHKNLGLLYARTGNVKDSVKELRLALRLDPKSEDARKALDILTKLSPSVSANP
jgi:tetratricopeptide (TPR) repeat protein